MPTTIVLSFLAGVRGGNGVPHLVRGITRRRYPSALGSGPVPHLVAGWFALSTTPLWLVWSPAGQHPVAAWVAGSLGVLAFGLFHAGPGAFGRPDDDTTGDGAA